MKIIAGLFVLVAAGPAHALEVDISGELGELRQEAPGDRFVFALCGIPVSLTEEVDGDTTVYAGQSMVGLLDGDVAVIALESVYPALDALCVGGRGSAPAPAPAPDGRSAGHTGFIGDGLTPARRDGHGSEYHARRVSVRTVAARERSDPRWMSLGWPSGVLRIAVD